MDCNFVIEMKAISSIVHTFVPVLFSFVGFTARGAVVSGDVEDANDGVSLPFCIIRLSPGQLTAVSDMEGRFRLECPDGQYELSASYMGYEEIKLPIMVKGSLDIKIELQPRAYTLDVVTVTAREGEGMTGGSKIDRAAMDHLQPSSFADLLELLPGNVSKDPSLTGANIITLR